jgi:lactoylglutathione lyase
MTSNPSAPTGSPTRAEPESFRARGLQLSLTVKDIHASLAWYTDVMGFTVDQMYENEGKLRAVALKAGDVRILIGQDDGKKGWERVKGEGFSFQFTTTQDIDSIANRIRSAGGKLDSEPADMPWGVRMFRMVDPDGFKFSISTPRPEK